MTNPNQALWEQGDFTRIADTMRSSGDELVGRLGVGPGMRVLDVGCGDGTTAIPIAQRGADVRGIDIARNLVDAGNKRAVAAGLPNVRFEHGDVMELAAVDDAAHDLTVSVFGAMFAPRPLEAASELVRVTRPGGRIVMGNWIPGDPTLVAQLLKISSAYAPPPPEGFVSPMLWGVPDEVRARFDAAGVPAERVECEPDTWVFDADRPPAEVLADFRDYYGPTMNAFAAAEAAGRAEELWGELAELFEAENTSEDPRRTRIAATYLRVTVGR